MIPLKQIRLCLEKQAVDNKYEMAAKVLESITHAYKSGLGFIGKHPFISTGLAVGTLVGLSKPMMDLVDISYDFNKRGIMVDQADTLKQISNKLSNNGGVVDNNIPYGTPQTPIQQQLY